MGRDLIWITGIDCTEGKEKVNNRKAFRKMNRQSSFRIRLE